MNNPDPVVLHIRIEDTPATNDPVGAAGFYRMLGMVSMAMGRLEGQFTLCLLMLMNLPGAEALGYILPISWKKRAEMWRRAFEGVPILQSRKDVALPLLAEIIDVMQDRHALAHAIWENFVPGPSLGVAAIRLKHKRGTTDGLESGRTTITLDMLSAILAKANILNRQLLPISQFLTSLRPAPPEAHRL
jgi:hypothetical protein